jgi:uracil-DNA glycosylase family 4
MSFKEDIKILNDEIKSCHKCPLYKNSQTVLGRGGDKFKIPVDVLFVGEAPGMQEAKEGKAFVGRSGKLLNDWVKVFRTDNWAVVNVVKHLPLNDEGKIRTPTQDEISACSPYLYRQIELFKPKAIVALGDTALRALTDNQEPISKIILTQQKYRNNESVPVFVYYHPAYVLRNLASVDWQTDIAKLAKMAIGESLAEASKLWSTAGVKAMMQEKELKETKVEDDLLSYPLIGIRTEYSFMQYGGKLDNEIKYIKSRSGKIVAVAYINSTSSFLKLNKMQEYGISVIYGSRIKTIFGTIALFARNFEGYKSLNKIVTFINTTEPKKLTNEDISNCIRDNSSGLALVIPSAEFSARNEDFISAIISSFGEFVFSGLSVSSLSAKISANYLADKYNIKKIAFQDNYYTQPEDYKLYLVIKSIKEHRTYDDVVVLDKNRINYIFPKTSFDDEIIRNTEEFVKLFEFKMPKYKNLLPENKVDFDPDIIITPEQIKSYSQEHEITEDEAEKRLKFKATVEKFDLNPWIMKYAQKKTIGLTAPLY